MEIRAYAESDWTEWLRLSQAMYPDDAAEELVKSMRKFLARSDARVFVARRPDGRLAGYVEVGARPYADGCDTSPVGYIEAWYVDPDVRRAGIGQKLLGAAEQWSLSQGYEEMASDALLENLVSHKAHEKAGYVEVERSVKFRKLLR